MTSIHRTIVALVVGAVFSYAGDTHSAQAASHASASVGHSGASMAKVVKEVGKVTAAVASVPIVILDSSLKSSSGNASFQTPLPVTQEPIMKYPDPHTAISSDQE